MFSINVRFRASSVPGRAGRLYYQIVSNGQQYQLTTNYRVFPTEWDRKYERLIYPTDDPVRSDQLAVIERCLANGAARWQALLGNYATGDARTACSSTGPKTALATFSPVGLISYGRRMAAMLRAGGQNRTAETYETALNRFEHYRGGYDVLLTDVSASLMMGFESYLREGRRLCRNTSSFYLRNLRAVYNRAVSDGLLQQAHPFAHVYTGVDKTARRALPLGAIRRIMGVDLNCLPHLKRARDVFMFSFFTRGMSFVDLCYLRQSNLTRGVLTYRRRKTGQALMIKWEPCMQRIVDCYRSPGNDHLLPLMLTAEDSYREYRNAERTVNRNLNRLGELLDLPLRLTMHVARHSWASVARSRNVPLAVISESMGHDSEQTTRIYLSTLDMSAIDRANHDIIKAL